MRSPTEGRRGAAALIREAPLARCGWEHARLVVEIDGRWHMEIRAWWADMQRDNELTVDGYRVLRFPAFVVRDTPELVAMLIARALNRAGG